MTAELLGQPDHERLREALRQLAAAWRTEYELRPAALELRRLLLEDWRLSHGRGVTDYERLAQLEVDGFLKPQLEVDGFLKP